jgi:transposase
MGELTPEEVKILIKASQITREKGITRGASVKEICDKAGISRKTGYQWVKEPNAPDNKDAQKLELIKKEHEKLQRQFKEALIKIEGLHLAMEIHGFDEVLKKKGILDQIKKRRQ